MFKTTIVKCDDHRKDRYYYYDIEVHATCSNGDCTCVDSWTGVRLVSTSERDAAALEVEAELQRDVIYVGCKDRGWSHPPETFSISFCPRCTIASQALMLIADMRRTGSVCGEYVDRVEALLERNDSSEFM